MESKVVQKQALSIVSSLYMGASSSVRYGYCSCPYIIWQIIISLTFEDTMIAHQILASSAPASNSAFQEMPGFPLRYYAEPLFVSKRLLRSGRTDSFKEAAAVVSATATGPSLSLVWRTTGQKCYCQMWGNMFYM